MQVLLFESLEFIRASGKLTQSGEVFLGGVFAALEPAVEIGDGLLTLVELRVDLLSQQLKVVEVILVEVLRDVKQTVVDFRVLEGSVVMLAGSI